jgi:processive 1,2-diacylglycerol beta-glucosyltransferase
MPSGHHQVADSLINSLADTDIHCKKVDILSYTNQTIEGVVTRMYLKTLNIWPNSYEQLYSLVAGPSEEQKKSKAIDFLLSSTLKSKMEELITQESPDFIICTHAFPSYLVNELKQEGKRMPPVVNVYTDFFINDIWGRKYIDYHFVSSEEMKSTLMKGGVPKEKIFITGIPIHQGSCI